MNISLSDKGLADSPRHRPDLAHLSGWIAVGLSTVIAAFWAFWGIIENFHEGWYHETLFANLGLMFIQYLSPMLFFMTISLIAIARPRIGAILHGLIAIVALWFFHVGTNSGLLILIAPLIGLGALYWFGNPRPRRLATALIVGLPILTLFISGAEPALRVSQRIDDNNLEARIVKGNSIVLIWAPAGPGWPRTGTDWNDAAQICAHLLDDGLTLAPEPQHIWRLPTVDEAVRSMTRQGQNSGGVWNAETSQPTYTIRPDKESPLWDVHSQIIYLWTATEIDATHAYIIVYDGKVWSRAKDLNPDYLGFRCVTEAPESD